MGADTIILAVGKWKRLHCMFPAGQGKVGRSLISPLCCFWPALPFTSEVSSAPGHCWCSAESPWWLRGTVVNEGVQHLVEDTAVTFTTLMGLVFLSAPLQAASAFGGRHLQMWKAVQQACFSHGKSNFWENVIFHGKSTLSRAIPTSPTQKTFWCLWECFFY